MVAILTFNLIIDRYLVHFKFLILFLIHLLYLSLLGLVTSLHEYAPESIIPEVGHWCFGSLTLLGGLSSLQDFNVDGGLYDWCFHF